MGAIQNYLLASLPRRARVDLVPQMTSVKLAFGDVLYEPDSLMRHVYFPSTCLVSLLTIVDGHLALEVGIVGREGIVGIPLALGFGSSAVRAIVQGEGDALRMSKVRFLGALHRSPPLRRGVNGYIHALMWQISQTAACNRFHVVEARLAKWLLMTRDRLESEEFRMTHDFLSSMLGVRREGVTKAASAFQQKKLIEYSRGKIRIVDHEGLEAASCSCYRRSTPDSVGTTMTWRPAGYLPRRTQANRGRVTPA